MEEYAKQEAIAFAHFVLCYDPFDSLDSEFSWNEYQKSKLKK